MNILLNLLPEDKKIFLKEKVRSRFVFSQMLMVLFFHGMYIVVVAGAFFALERDELSFQGTTRQLASEESHQELLEIEKKFQEVNKKVEIAIKLNTEHLHFTELLARIDRVLPAGVTLSGVNTKDYVVSIAGKAPERSDMVLLEKNLSEESCFASVDIPPSVWLSPKDIAFQISFSVKKECLKR